MAVSTEIAREETRLVELALAESRQNNPVVLTEDLELFQAILLSEAEERHRLWKEQQERSRQERILRQNIEANRLQGIDLPPELFAAIAFVVIKPCGQCLEEERERCKHLSGEEFLFFSRMSATCKAWKRAVDHFFFHEKPSLLCGHPRHRGMGHKQHDIPYLQETSFSHFAATFTYHDQRFDVAQEAVTRRTCFCQDRRWHYFCRHQANPSRGRGLLVHYFDSSFPFMLTQEDVDRQYAQFQASIRDRINRNKMDKMASETRRVEFH